MWDVLAVGAVAVDEISYVNKFPRPNTKTEVSSTERQVGGLAATVLVTVSHMGGRGAYLGALGEDELSRYAIRGLEQEGVDCSTVIDVPAARPFHSCVVVDESSASRTILFSPEGVTAVADRFITRELISSCKVLFVDNTGGSAALRAAKLAREIGRPVIADIERITGPETSELIEYVDHLVVGIELGAEVAADERPDIVADRLIQNGHNAVVVTAGERGCWWSDQDRKVHHHPAFFVRAVDTLGCGDVFHGAYAATVAAGGSVEDAVRTASAAAAIMATRRGVGPAVPRRVEVDEFIARYTAGELWSASAQTY